MMLQFLTTMKDLTMFAQKYEADLGDLAKIQVEMQFKSLNSWIRKTSGMRAGIKLAYVDLHAAVRPQLDFPWTLLRDCFPFPA